MSFNLRLKSTLPGTAEPLRHSTGNRSISQETISGREEQHCPSDVNRRKDECADGTRMVLEKSMLKTIAALIVQGIEPECCSIMIERLRMLSDELGTCCRLVKLVRNASGRNSGQRN